LKASVLVAVAALVATGIFLPAQGARADDMKGMAMPARPAASEADKAFAASMETMMQGMNVQPTGKAG
jgi:hypothetical protein